MSSLQLPSLLQRTVIVRIDDVDKNGIAMGRLYLQVPMPPPPGIPTTPGGGPPHKQQGRQGRGAGRTNNSNNNSGKGNSSHGAVAAPSPSSSSSSNHPTLTMTSKPYALMLVSEGLARVDRKFKPGIASLANDHGVTEKETQDLLVAQAIAIAAKKVTFLKICQRHSSLSVSV